MRSSFSLAAALAALVTAPGAAQAVAGTLIDPSGAAVPAARVLLLDSLGVSRASSLTDASGAFRLSAPGAGRYRVAAERVGFASTRSAPVQLGPGETGTVRLVASSTAISLTGVTVRGGSSRCRLARESGRATALLWE